MISVYKFAWWSGASYGNGFVEVTAENLEDAKKRYTELTGNSADNLQIINIEQRMGQSDLVKALKDFLE